LRPYHANYFLFELLTSMKAFLKIAELKYLRKVNEYKAFYSENKIQEMFLPFHKFRL
jgi:hypothetical protein